MAKETNAAARHTVFDKPSVTCENVDTVKVSKDGLSERLKYAPSKPSNKSTMWQDRIDAYNDQIHQLRLAEERCIESGSAAIESIKETACVIVNRITLQVNTMINEVQSTINETQKLLTQTRKTVLGAIDTLLLNEDKALDSTGLQIEMIDVKIHFEAATFSPETIIGKLTCVPKATTQQRSPRQYLDLFGMNDLHYLMSETRESLHSRKRPVGVMWYCSSHNKHRQLADYKPRSCYADRERHVENRCVFYSEDVNQLVIKDLTSKVQKKTYIKVSDIDVPRYWTRHRIVFFRVVGRLRDDLSHYVKEYRRESLHMGRMLMVAMHVTYPHRLDAFREPVLSADDPLQLQEVAHVLYTDKHGVADCPVNTKAINKLAEFVCGPQQRRKLVDVRFTKIADKSHTQEQPEKEMEHNY